MQREIKLKFWDKVLNCWSGDSHHLISDGMFAWAPEKGNRYIPVEFTGLHDKNGKEIYEGDIVTNGREKIIIDIDAIGDGCSPFIEIAACGWQCSDGSDAEVIGNIYENPELLAGDKP